MEVESGKSESRAQDWNQYAIRSEYYCRYYVKHKGELSSEKNRFKTDTMKIKLEAAQNTDFYFLYFAKESFKTTGQIDSNTQAIKIPAGKTVQISRIEQG